MISACLMQNSGSVSRLLTGGGDKERTSVGYSIQTQQNTALALNIDEWNFFLELILPAQAVLAISGENSKIKKLAQMQRGPLAFNEFKMSYVF